MTVDQIIVLALEKGGLLGIGLVALYLLNEVWKARLKEVERYAGELKQYAELYRADANAFRDALKEATAAMTRLTEQLQQKTS